MGAGLLCRSSARWPGYDHAVTDDLVDSFYSHLVQPLGNLVILFAQAEASLLQLVATLKGVDEWQAQDVLKAKDAKEQAIRLVMTAGFGAFEAELRYSVEGFWSDKARRNRYIHDEWFPLLAEGGIPATRGLPYKKGSGIVFDDPTADDVWGLAKRFRDHQERFSHGVYILQRGADGVCS
jgi:hypothetical protein